MRRTREGRKKRQRGGGEGRSVVTGGQMREGEWVKGGGGGEGRRIDRRKRR